MTEIVPITALRSDDGAAPIGWLGIAAPGIAPSETDTFFLRGQFRSLVLAAGVALALSAVAAVLVGRQFLSPIRALETGARRLASGDYAARIPNARGDELGRLIDHYNELAGSLEAAEIAERRWISDTSHELQTPLAVLRANIEAVQDGVRQPDERTMRSMHASVERLSRLVQDLRILSDRREGGLAVLRRDADMVTLIQEALDDDADRFAEAGIAIETDLPEELVVDCDPQRLRQVIDNLLENALRYTDAPGRLRLHAWSEGDSAQLVFEDTAPAPAPEALPQLFDRFFRGESSRSRALGGGGLGLSICKAIVEAHDGTITAKLSPLGGLAIQLSLPRNEAP